MTGKSFLTRTKEIKKNSQLTLNPKKYIISFIQEKTFKKNLIKAWNTLENTSKKKGVQEIICYSKGPYENGQQGALFDFCVGAKGGRYICRISFNWEKDFKITVSSDCELLKKNDDEIILYALKSFEPTKDKEAKKYFIDLVYELGKVRIEGKY
jgi:hypothetical protein